MSGEGFLSSGAERWANNDALLSATAGDERTHDATSAVNDDLPGDACADWRFPISPELGDVIAHLEQRRDNAATIASRMAPHEEMAMLATDRRQQTEVIIDDLKAGMHVGAAQVRADLAAKAAAEAAAVAEIMNG